MSFPIIVLTPLEQKKWFRGLVLGFLGLTSTTIVLMLIGFHPRSVLNVSLSGIVFFKIVVHQIRSDKLALWLRRFKKQQNGLRFEKLLFHASLMAIPITVQDVSVNLSAYSATIRILDKLITAIIVFMISMFFVFISILFLAGDFLGTYFGESSVTVIMAMTVTAALVLSIGYLFYGWRTTGLSGYYDLHVSNIVEEVERTIRKALARWYPFYTLEIFRCPDSHWQAAVLAFIKAADLVIIDISELTENVVWEMRSVIALKRPQQVLIATSSDSDSAGKLPAMVLSIVEETWDADQIRQIGIFHYPEHQPSNVFKRWIVYQHLAKRLKLEYESRLYDKSPGRGSCYKKHE